MAIITSGGDDVISLSLTTPRVGVWSADVLFDAASPRAGRVALAVSNGQTFVGTVDPDRGGEFEDADRTRVVAGAGGMGRNATPRQYGPVSVRIVLGDLLAAAGEVLATSASPGVLGASLESWTTSGEPVGVVLSALMTTVGGGAVWRSLPDGTIWVGRETWPDSELDPETYQVLDKRFEDGSWMVSVDETAVCVLLPGTLLEGLKVSVVVHRVDDEEAPGPRMRIWFADSDETALEDRLDIAIGRAVRAALAPAVDYRAMYRARVVAQTGSTIHVEPEIAGSIPDMGSIPLYTGLPGASVDGVQGGNVLVGWRGGDRSKAYAVAFDGDTKVRTMVLAVLQELALGGAGGQAPPLGGPLLKYLTTMATAINGLAPGSVLPPDPGTLLAKKVTVL